MSDSVDRVFSHALNTVNKIRTGSEKPPSATRLKLYGLYKQSMEGDVEGILDRPEGRTEDDRRAQEKWDAWKQQSGLSRTEAKRRYITTLIETMHQYASPSPDARELVAELSFIWDQVKSNVPSSSSSSPLQTLGASQLAGQDAYPVMGFSQDSRNFRSDQPRDYDKEEAPMKVLSPLSQSEIDDVEAAREEEFVDAQDSQYNPQLDSQEEEEGEAAGGEPTNRSIAKNRNDTFGASSISPTDQKWRRRIEQAIVRMTAEIAALREQLESRRLFGHTRRETFFRWLAWLGWNTLKYIAFNAIVLTVLLWWLRRRRDRRLEGAIRVLLGDAVAQVRKVGGQSVAQLPLPGMKARKS